MEDLLEILNATKPNVDFTRDDLIEAGELDSIDILEIINEVENHFHIRIAPDMIDPDNFNSADSMWEMIQGLMNK